MSPPSVIALPPRLNAPAGISKVMPLNDVPGVKSLVLLRRIVPVKKSKSPIVGAAPPQLAGVLQLLSLPPPVHVRSAPCTGLTKQAAANNAVEDATTKSSARRYGTEFFMMVVVGMDAPRGGRVEQAW